MQIKFNPTGTHVKNGLLKVRLDLYPEPTEKTFVLHNIQVIVYPDESLPLNGYTGKMTFVDEHWEYNPVDGGAELIPAMWVPDTQSAYDRWEARLPHIWRVNPCLCHFVTIAENMTLTDLFAGVNQIFSGDLLATLDNSLVLPNSAHYVSPLMRNKYLSDERVKTADLVDLVNSVNLRFASLATIQKDLGTAFDVQPQTIDVGSGAIDRASVSALHNLTDFWTSIDKGNPANATGEIDTFQIYINTSAAYAIYAGTFTDNGGNNLTCTDAENVGNPAGTGLNTFTGLTMSITSGDLLGVSAPEGGSYTIRLDDATTGPGRYYLQNVNGCVATHNGDYGLSADKTLSLYGTGTESGGALFTPFYYLGANRS